MQWPQSWQISIIQSVHSNQNIPSGRKSIEPKWAFCWKADEKIVCGHIAISTTPSQRIGSPFRVRSAVLLTGVAVVCISRTLPNVSLSTTEAEYVATGACVKGGLFIGAILKFRQPHLGDTCVCKRVPVRTRTAKQGANQSADNPLSSGKSKHIDRREVSLYEGTRRRERD